MKKIFTFHGADHKCGCSMLSQCVAERVAQKRGDISVLLLHAEESEGCGYAPMVGESMERIRPYLADRLLDVGDIVKKSEYKDNLYVIAGTDRPGSSESFHPDMAQYFLGAIAGSFDIVICDSGANIEHGLSLGALFASDFIYVVLVQQESAFRRYEWLQPLYGKLALNIGGYVINRFIPQSGYTRDYVRRRLKTKRDRVFTVKESAYGKVAEIDEKSLLAYKDAAFAKDIDALADDIIAQADVSERLLAANG